MCTKKRVKKSENKKFDEKENNKFLCKFQHTKKLCVRDSRLKYPAIEKQIPKRKIMVCRAQSAEADTYNNIGHEQKIRKKLKNLAKITLIAHKYKFTNVFYRN